MYQLFLRHGSRRLSISEPCASIDELRDVVWAGAYFIDNHVDENGVIVIREYDRNGREIRTWEIEKVNTEGTKNATH